MQCLLFISNKVKCATCETCETSHLFQQYTAGGLFFVLFFKTWGECLCFFLVFFVLGVPMF